MTYEGTSLTLGDETVMMRFFFTLTDNMAECLHFEVNGTQVAPEKRGTYYTVDVEGLSPAEWDTPYRITLTTDDDYWCISYSVLSYACNALTTSGDATLQQLAKALYLYNQV